MKKNKQPPRYQKALHALMPIHLYEHLLRTAAEWAIDGDIECARWFLQELETRDYQSAKAEFETIRRNTDFLDQYKGKPCAWCGAPSNSIDHIVPLVRGGTNDASNLQPMCRRCNSKKGDRITVE